MRPVTKLQPADELEKNGSRKFGSSLSYGFDVTSLHAPPVSGRAAADLKAAANAPG